MKLIDLQSYSKPQRRERGALRYFKDNRVDGGIFSGLLPNVDESHRAEEQKHQDETRNKERNQQAQRPQTQQPQNLNQPKAQTLDQSVRDDHEHHESREARQSQQTQNQQVLRTASGQDLRETFRDQFQSQQPNQAHSELRSSSTGPQNFLQNVRNLAGQNQRAEQNLTGENLPSMSRSPNASQTQAHQPTVRIADLSRFAGVQEHSPMPQQGPTANMAQMMGRTPQGRAQAFNPESPFSRMPNQAFGRAWNPQTFGQLIQQAASHLPDQHPSLTNQNLPVTAFFQGNMLFVKDGDRTRMYRLMEDGSLHESSNEHEGAPLTPEARAEMSRVLKQKGVHARLSGDKEALVEKQGLTEDEKGTHASDRSLSARGELRSLAREDTRFANLLREVLEEGRDVGQELGEGEDAHFASKGDWGSFFSRMLGMGSAEKQSKKTFDQMMSFIFRGLYKKQGDSGQTLVSDIKYQLSGKMKEDRFAQIGITNEQLLELLQNFKPGQPISKDMLRKFMGEEISFTQLLHVIQKSDPILASELLKNVKFDPTSNTNLYDQAKLEHHIFSKSRRQPGMMGSGAGTSSPETHNPVFAGNVYELHDKQSREVPGKAKLYTVLTYASIVGAIVFTLYFLLKAL